MTHSLTDLDFYQLDDLLSPEEKMTREAIRQFVQREVLPGVERHFASETFPVELVPRMAQLGIFGANLKGYGCAGMNNISYGLIMQELEAGDSGLRSFASVQSALAMYAIYSSGSEEQKNRYLPGMAQGKLIGCFGLTEPDHGSDPGGMETRARKDGRGWVLNGTKRWITNGSIADLAIVWARVEEGITGFIVEKGTLGFSTRDIHGKFSMRASITSELVFDDVRLDEAHHLPNARGLRAPLSCLTQARFGIMHLRICILEVVNRLCLDLLGQEHLRLGCEADLVTLLDGSQGDIRELEVRFRSTHVGNRRRKNIERSFYIEDDILDRLVEVKVRGD